LFSELGLAITHIAGPTELGTDVMIQVACQVQDQVADGVSRPNRLVPQRTLRKRGHELVNRIAKLLQLFDDRPAHRKPGVEKGDCPF
jgi:hypothetical protein